MNLRANCLWRSVQRKGPGNGPWKTSERMSGAPSTTELQVSMCSGYDLCQHG